VKNVGVAAMLKLQRIHEELACHVLEKVIDIKINFLNIKNKYLFIN
tara:strand:- start:762 stop:899 length:138 start_codon:yes stop_codon:yes gene_type:complete